MTEPVPQLKSPMELEYERRLELLHESSNGFVFEDRDGTPVVMYLGIRREDGVDKDHIVEFETELASEEEMLRITDDIDTDQLIRRIWTFNIDAYNSKEIPLIQSLPGTGKTHAFHRFGQLLHGEYSESIREDLMCTPKTSELEILGKWVPRGNEQVSIEEMRRQLSESDAWRHFLSDHEYRLAALYGRRSELPDDEFAEIWGELDKEYQERQLKILAELFPDVKEGQWRFEEGALVRAYQNESDPSDLGSMLLVDEVDNLPENYQNIFLQIAGEGGRLASTLTVYAGEKKTIYRRGPKTFIVFAANYPEFAQGKRAVSSPLADRVVWLSITPEESRASERRRIEKSAFRKLGEHLPGASPLVVEKLRDILAHALAVFHDGWKQAFSQFNKFDRQGGGGTPREQTKEYSQRETARIENFIYENVGSLYYANRRTGHPDLKQLLEYAIRSHYMAYLASPEAEIQAQNELLLPILYGGRRYVEKSGKGYVVREEERLSEGAFTYVEDAGTYRPYDPDMDDGKDVFAFDQVIAELTAKAFETEADRAAALEAKRKEILEMDIDALLTEVEQRTSA